MITMITFNQMIIYISICTLISICIYAILSVYTIKNRGTKKSLIDAIPMFLAFYITLLFTGMFVLFGLSISYSVVFQSVNVDGISKGFTVLFGVLFAYFPIAILSNQLKVIAYDVLMSCVQKYN